MWPPVMTTARAPRSTNLRAAASIPATSLISIPVSSAASAILGVTTEARLINSSPRYFTPLASSRSAPPALGVDHRVQDHVLKISFVEKFGDRRGVSARSEHADFDGGDLQILRQGVELRAQRRRGRRMDGLHALRGLHGERGDRRDAVAVMRGKSFQVGADTRAAGRIETGDRQNNGERMIADDYSTNQLPPRRQQFRGADWRAAPANGENRR